MTLTIRRMRHELKIIKLDESVQQRSIIKLQKEYMGEHNSKSFYKNISKRALPKNQKNNSNPLLPKFTCSKTCNESVSSPLHSTRRNLTKLAQGRPRVKLHVFGNDSLNSKNTGTQVHRGTRHQAMIKKAKSWVEIFWKNSTLDYEQLENYELHHFVWFGHTREDSFHLLHYLSLLSTLQTLPENGKIVFHTDSEPHVDNKFWIDIRRRTENKLIIFVPEQRKIDFIDDNHKTASHMNDMYRVLVLLHFGGVYKDIETISINPVTQILEKLNRSARNSGKHKIFASQISTTAVSNSFLIAPRNAEILYKWLIEFEYFHPAKDVRKFAVESLYALGSEFPDEIIMDDSGDSVRPGAHEQVVLFDNYRHYYWERQYGIHVLLNRFPRDLKTVFLTCSDLDCLSEFGCSEGSIGEILRFVIYGESNFC